MVRNPTRSEGESCYSARQLEGTDSCLDLLDLRKLFAFPLFFLIQANLSRWPRGSKYIAFTGDRGQIDSRWSFYELLALELLFINLKQMGGIKMRDWFMPLTGLFLQAVGNMRIFCGSSHGRHARLRTSYLLRTFWQRDQDTQRFPYDHAGTKRNGNSRTPRVTI